MLEELFLLVIVLAVAALMVADVVRTRNEGFHGHADVQAFDARRPAAVARPGSRESFSRTPAGAAMPAAVHDVGPVGPPAGGGTSAGADSRSRADAVAVPRGSRRRLKDWRVGSRLLLLVVIPLATAAVIALCLAYMIHVLHGARANSNGAVMSALATVVAIVVVALASWLVIAVAKSILQPLYRLRTGALELTGDRLAATVRRASQANGKRDGVPFNLEPIDVDASSEIGEIARAFDEMRKEFLRLAVGEAAHHGKLNATFLDVSHRGQSFMERQIRLLQSLEQGEPNDERLAMLFRAKRIGNRMHRYSENLLILVGHEPASGWNQPVPLASVIRAAVSELEEYQRVSVNAQPDVAVVGSAVNDTVHLLIELTENATSFSAADMQVDISGRMLASGGVLLEITDRGVGMTPKELAFANWQLENPPPAADTNIPKWIGLLVVARLAGRHGIRVRLQSADFGGITALVWLPDIVLTQPGGMATRPGGFAAAGSRRDLQEAVPNLADATAQRGMATARSAPQPRNIRNTTLDRRSIPDGGLPSSAEPWSPAAVRSAPHAGPPATIASQVSEHAAVAEQPDPDFRNASARAIRSGNLTGGPDASLSQGTSSDADSVIVPPAADRGDEQQLPVFNSVESSWFRDGRGVPTLAGNTAATGGRWSSPADTGWRAASAANSPASAGSTIAGLPKRTPNANLVPGTIPSAEPVIPSRSPAAARERLSALQRGVDKGRAATRQAASHGEGEETQPGAADLARSAERPASGWRLGRR